MVSNKAARGQSSKISSSAAPTTASTTHSAQKSSILRSRFSPSEFQLSLFASVIQGLEGQHLRIHDIATGRLRCEHAINSKATINCLDWGHYGENHSDLQHQESKKKRKRNEKVNGSQVDPKDVVIAFGTSESEIHLFSPSESKILRTLRGEHTQGVRDFKFSKEGSKCEAWSIGGDGKLVQWDLRTGKSISSLKAPSVSVATVHPTSNTLLCASHTTYLLDLKTKKELHSFTASGNAVHTMLTPQNHDVLPSTFLTASEAERSINVFDVDGQRLAGTLVPEAETTCLALSPAKQLHNKNMSNGNVPHGAHNLTHSLAAVNKEGSIELFPSPFDFATASTAKDSQSVKARRKGMTRKATASIKITRPDKSSTLVPILNVSFDGDDIVIAWTEGGVNVLFDRIPWREEHTGNMLLQGVHEIVKAKAGAGIGGVVMNGVKDMGKSYVDDAHTVVGDGGDALLGMDPSSAIDISSAEEESEYSEEEDEDQDQLIRPDPSSQTSSQEEDEDRSPQPISQRHSPEDEDVDMEDADDDDVVAGQEEDEANMEKAEPSFGEMIRANAQEAIDVQASFPTQDSHAITAAGERSLQLPSGMSLGTVLTQSLRTNDNNLLETCFHVRDLRTVRATIERIDSPLATILLQRLTERLHSRPGRAGSLMVWIQWTLVAHGGYLAGQPAVVKKLNSLHRVVAERANSLQSLLSLKGKLDMLEAQMNLRKSMQSRSRSSNTLDEDDEEGVIYVEGQEESDDSESDDEAEGDLPTRPSGKDARELEVGASADEASDSEGVDEEEDDEMPTTMNGFVADSEDEGSESDDEGLIDDEAEFTDADSDDGISADEVDHDDVSSVDSEASSEPENIPPAKRIAKTKLTNGITKKSR